MTCTTCDNTGCVCENHVPPWGRSSRVLLRRCRRACPHCNVSAEGEAPRMRGSFRRASSAGLSTRR
jgi:hypothetical protein